MPRYIDADEFIKEQCNSCDGYCEKVDCDCLSCDKPYQCDMIQELKAAPTISPDEVRGDGRWIHFTQKYIRGVDDEGVPMIRCSVCDYTQFESSRSSTNYCPNCGAKMEVSEDA